MIGNALVPLRSRTRIPTLFVFALVLLPSLSAAKSISTGTIAFPSETLAVPLGASVESFSQKHPTASEPPVVISASTGIARVFFERLAGNSEATYHFVDGTLAAVSAAWFLPISGASDALNALLEPCKELWGESYELVVLEYAQAGGEERFVDYVWQLPDGTARLRFALSGRAVTVSRDDGRGARRRTPTRELSGEERDRVLVEFGFGRP